MGYTLYVMITHAFSEYVESICQTVCICVVFLPQSYFALNAFVKLMASHTHTSLGEKHVNTRML